MELERESEVPVALDDVYVLPVLDENPSTDETEDVVTKEYEENVPKDEEPANAVISASQEITSPTHITCLTVQPNRVLCGVSNCTRAASNVMFVWFIEINPVFCITGTQRNIYTDLLVFSGAKGSS